MSEPITKKAGKPTGKNPVKVPKAPPRGTPLSVHVKTPFGVSPVGVSVEAVSLFKAPIAPRSGARLDKTILNVNADGIHDFDVDPANKDAVEPGLKIAIPASDPPKPLDADECIININGFKAGLGPVPTADKPFAAGSVFASIRFKKGSAAFGPKTPLELEFADDFQRIEGIDVSKHQGKIDWAKVKAQNLIKFAYIKATEGKNGKDDRFDINWREAHANGLLRGAYHFFRPTVDAKGGEEQAEWFWATLHEQQTDDSDLPPMVDVEFLKTHTEERLNAKTNKTEKVVVADNPQPTTPQQNVASLQSFITRFTGLSRRQPVIYTYKSYWTNQMGNSTDFSASSRLWMAVYPGPPIKNSKGKVIGNGMPPPGAEPGLCGGWTDWGIWQYAVMKGVDGIDTMVDHDVAKVPNGKTLLEFLNAGTVI